VPGNRRIARIELLRGEKSIPFQQQDGGIEFSIPQVVDYEVAALSVV
jgi:hypothetical protein